MTIRRQVEEGLRNAGITGEIAEKIKTSILDVTPEPSLVEDMVDLFKLESWWLSDSKRKESAKKILEFLYDEGWQFTK